MKKYSFHLLSFILIVILFGACKPSTRLAYLKNNKIDYKQDDTLFSYTSHQEAYKINKNDILMIRFASTNEEVTKYFEDFSGLNDKYANNNNVNLQGMNVNDSGYIEVPIIGKFYAEGYTIDGLQNALQLEANKYLINSRIIVRLLNFKITFLGEVNRQGVLQVTENQINLIEAFAQMGGITDYGDRANILIIRKSDNGFITFRIDITDRELLEKTQFYLFPNDMVIVEPRRYKILTTNLRDYSSLLATITSILTALTLIFSLNGK